MKTLPKYYYVKKDLNNPLWKKFKNWFDKEFNTCWKENYLYYGYDGTFGYGGTDVHDYPSLFQNNAIEITLEDWDESVNGYTLPDKWCIETCEEVGNWLDKNSDLPEESRFSRGYANSDFKYLYYPSFGNSHIFNTVYNGYTKINLAEFRKYILNKNTMEKETYTLPDKWCIRLVTKEAVDYCNKYGKKPPYFISNYVYAHFPSPDNYATTFVKLNKDI